MEKPKEIDINLYSRQLGTYGAETQSKIMKMKVLIIGLRGLGVETAKNLILAGPNLVHIYDPYIAEIRDLSSNFFLREKNIGKDPRAKACLQSLKDLNSYVTVEELSQFNLKVIPEYDEIIMTELFKECDPFEINNACRIHKNVGFTLAQAFGLSCHIFNDFGEAFTIFDKDGEEIKQYIVTGITQSDPAVINLAEERVIQFGDGDHIVIRGVEGMEEINKLDPLQCTLKSKFSLTIPLNSTNFKPYLNGGILENAKVPIIQKFFNLENSLVNPIPDKDSPFIIADFKYEKRPDQLHMCLCAILVFWKKHGRYPKINSHDESKEVLEIAKKMNEENKLSNKFYVEKLDEELITTIALIADCRLTSMCSFMGGIVAQEALKHVGKYSPLRQWFHFDNLETFCKEGDKAPLNCRYDDFISVYGRKLVEDLSYQNVFMIGAGAVGCEITKCLALMGIGAKNGLITTADNDHIEVSNLNRQFLFKKGNVGQSKAQVACNVGIEMNPDMKFKPLVGFVGPETEDTFDDNFWETQNFIICAVDNIKARLYVDMKSVWHKKPFLEAGTLGPKANNSVVIPGLTQCYGDSRDPPEESFPMCTIRNFPNVIEHCIEWGRNLFETLFVEAPSDVQNYVKDVKGFKNRLNTSTTTSGQIEILKRVYEYIDLKKTISIEKCVEIARVRFQEFYFNVISQLLYTFPENYKDDNGILFWSGSKKAPNPLVFDSNDDLHLLFIKSYVNILAYIMELKPISDDKMLKSLIEKVKILPFEPKKVKINLNEGKEEKKEEILTEEDEKELKELINLLDKLQLNSIGKIKVVEFEKDDDTNYHIDFIHACSILRARCYKIKEINREKTKFIAGKIIPAIATSTATIVGCLMNELIKVVQKVDKIEGYKGGFVNMALNMFMFSEPLPAIKIKSKEYDPIMAGPVKAIPEGYTIWDRIEIKGPKTVSEMKAYFAKEYNVEVNMIACGSFLIYNQYLPGNPHKARENLTLENVVNSYNERKLPDKIKYLTLEIGADTIAKGENAMMPQIKYIFK